MTTLKSPQESCDVSAGAQIPFSAINTSGAYFSNWTGHLIRVPEDAVKPGRSPVIDIVGRQNMMVTRLSNDPYITLTKARLVAADMDLDVNF